MLLSDLVVCEDTLHVQQFSSLDQQWASQSMHVISFSNPPHHHLQLFLLLQELLYPDEILRWKT